MAGRPAHVAVALDTTACRHCHRPEPSVYPDLRGGVACVSRARRGAGDRQAQPRLHHPWHHVACTVSAWLVGVARAYAKHCGRLADQHLCVTDALRSWLISNFGLAPERVTVLHDQAPEHFARLSPPERHELFTKLDEHFRWPELELDRNGVDRSSRRRPSTEAQSAVQGTFA
jgi:hypothetical protein